jgi:hypothetical protein
MSTLDEPGLPVIFEGFSVIETSARRVHLGWRTSSRSQLGSVASIGESGLEQSETVSFQAKNI